MEYDIFSLSNRSFVTIEVFPISLDIELYTFQCEMTKLIEEI